MAAFLPKSIPTKISMLVHMWDFSPADDQRKSDHPAQRAVSRSIRNLHICKMHAENFWHTTSKNPDNEQSPPASVHFSAINKLFNRFSCRFSSICCLAVPPLRPVEVLMRDCVAPQPQDDC